MLYLIKSGDYIKIGYTNDLKKRYNQYLTHNPSLKMIGIKQGTRKDETQYHKLYEEYMIPSSEWMKVPDDIFQKLCLEFSIDPNEFVYIGQTFLNENLKSMSHNEMKMLLLLAFSLKFGSQIIYVNGGKYKELEKEYFSKAATDVTLRSMQRKNFIKSLGRGKYEIPYNIAHRDFDVDEIFEYSKKLEK